MLLFIQFNALYNTITENKHTCALYLNFLNRNNVKEIKKIHLLENDFVEVCKYLGRYKSENISAKAVFSFQLCFK